MEEPHEEREQDVQPEAEHPAPRRDPYPDQIRDINREQYPHTLAIRTHDFSAIGRREGDALLTSVRRMLGRADLVAIEETETRAERVLCFEEYEDYEMIKCMYPYLKAERPQQYTLSNPWEDGGSLEYAYRVDVEISTYLSYHAFHRAIFQIARQHGNVDFTNIDSVPLNDMERRVARFTRWHACIQYEEREEALDLLEDFEGWERWEQGLRFRDASITAWYEDEVHPFNPRHLGDGDMSSDSDDDSDEDGQGYGNGFRPGQRQGQGQGEGGGGGRRPGFDALSEGRRTPPPAYLGPRPPPNADPHAAHIPALALPRENQGQLNPQAPAQAQAPEHLHHHHQAHLEPPQDQQGPQHDPQAQAQARQQAQPQIQPQPHPQARPHENQAPTQPHVHHRAHPNKRRRQRARLALEKKERIRMQRKARRLRKRINVESGGEAGIAHEQEEEEGNNEIALDDAREEIDDEIDAGASEETGGNEYGDGSSAQRSVEGGGNEAEV